MDERSRWRAGLWPALTSRRFSKVHLVQIHPPTTSQVQSGQDVRAPFPLILAPFGGPETMESLLGSALRA